MLVSPQRAQEDLDRDLAKIRVTTRMRFGVVAGVIIVGLIQTNFDLASDAQGTLIAALPVVGLAAVGAGVVLALRYRDIKKARGHYESRIFHVPKRKDRS